MASYKTKYHRTTYHRDGTVTVWDVYRQQWWRSDALKIYQDHQVMASLNSHERARIEAIAHGMTLTAAKAMARRLVRNANDEGTIQAHQMVEIAGNLDPKLHTTMSVETAARKLGCYYSLPEY